jgi:putative tryptophan/tyrosine transport system substrate-binding protein
MKRREFITLLGGVAAAWPIAARAQQSAMPVIGFFHAASFEVRREYLPWFHKGLGEVGYTDGRNVRIEYRWAHDQYDQLPRLAAELVRQNVSVLVILESTHGALSAKAATQNIPIVFLQGGDPVETGLTRNLNHPGGNVTGFTLLMSGTVGKRLELLHELVPAAKMIGYLRNPTNPAYTKIETEAMQVAARALGIRLLVVDANQPAEIENAFGNLVQQKAGALLVSADGLLTTTHAGQIVALAGHHAIPTSYLLGEIVSAGGLMSYGPDLFDAWRQAGVYTGRILKGEAAGDLPVQQVTKLRLVINSKTAKALGLTVPDKLLVRADEVIE